MKILNSIKDRLRKIKNEDTMEIIKKSSSSLFLKIIGTLLGILLTLIITRNYGANAFGFFSLSLAILNIITIFTKFGSDKAFLRYISHDIACNKGSNINYILKKIIFLIVPLSILVSSIIFIFSDFISLYWVNSKEYITWLKITSLGILPMTLIIILSQGLRGAKLVEWSIFFSSISKKLTAILLLFILLFFNLGEINIILSYVLALFFNTIAIFFLWFSFFKIDFTSDIKIKIKEIIQKSFPMMLSSVMYVVFLRSDKLIISFFDTASNLGIYSLAVKIATFSVIFLSAANQILAPKISATYSQGNKERMINVINTGTKLVFWFSLPLIILLVIFSDFILGIFGPEFIEGKNALLILLVGFLANILSGPVGQVLQMTNREKVFQNIMVISAILNVILNFILIPFYGIVGAAISTTLCNIFWNLVSVYKIKKDLEVSTLYNPLKL